MSKLALIEWKKKKKEEELLWCQSYRRELRRGKHPDDFKFVLVA